MREYVDEWKLIGKRKSVYYVIFLMALFVSVLCNAHAESEFAYSDNGDGTVTVTGYLGSAKEIVIPEQMDGKKVTAIGKDAFKTKSIINVQIPGTLTTIGAGAFQSTDITAVNIPQSVTTIDKSAFENCIQLSSVTMQGENLKTIGQEAFAKCLKLTSVEIPVSVDNIGEQAFASIPSLSYKMLGKTVTYGSKVFQNTKLKTVICRQDSTTYKYVKSMTKNIKYTGVYLSSFSTSISIGKEVSVPVKQASENVIYTSSDETVATVSDKGVATGRKKGTVTITITDGEDSLKYKVTVKNLSINKKKMTVTVGYTGKLSVKNGKNVIWSTSNAAVASVSEKGVVKGQKKGTAKISAKVENATYTCKVTVKSNTTTISKYSTDPYAHSGGILGFSQLSKTGSGYKVTGHFINATSKKIKGIKNLTITVKAGGKVVARKKVSNIKLNLGKRKTRKLTFTFSGSNVKKNVDLRKCRNVAVTTSGGKFYYVTTRTVVVKKKEKS